MSKIITWHEFLESEKERRALKCTTCGFIIKKLFISEINNDIEVHRRTFGHLKFVSIND